METKAKKILRVAVVAALYATLTLALAPISYGNIQLRVSEVLVLLAFFDPFYIAGLTLGCLIANLLGPNGILDVLLGTLATFLSVLSITLTAKLFHKHKKGLYVASLWPTLFNGLIIGAMLHYLYALPLFLTVAEVAIGEFFVVSFIGVPFVLWVEKKYPHLLTISRQFYNHFMD